MPYFQDTLTEALEAFSDDDEFGASPEDTATWIMDSLADYYNREKRTEIDPVNLKELVKLFLEMYDLPADDVRIIPYSKVGFLISINIEGHWFDRELVLSKLDNKWTYLVH